jgi:excinuclease UvrABC nuclease subunit
METHTPGAPRSTCEYAKVAEQIAEYVDLTPTQMAAKVRQLERDMYRAARRQGFKQAAAIHDLIKELRGQGFEARARRGAACPAQSLYAKSALICRQMGLYSGRSPPAKF